MSRPGRLLALAAVLAAAPPTWGTPAEPVMRSADDRLSVRLENAERRSVLEHLATATGAEIRGSLAEEGTVTARFDRLPMPDALERVLGTGSFALRYDRDGRLKTIELIGEGKPATIVASPAAPGAKPMEALAADPTLRLQGTLAQLLGPQTSFRQLGDVVMSNPDPQLRREALGRMLRAINADEQLRRAVEEALRESDDAAVLDKARALGGVYAEEMLEQVTREAKGELAARARTMLQSLRAERAAR